MLQPPRVFCKKSACMKETSASESLNNELPGRVLQGIYTPSRQSQFMTIVVRMCVKYLPEILFLNK